MNRTRFVYLLLAAALAALWIRSRPEGEPIEQGTSLDWRPDPVQLDTGRAPFDIATRKGPATLTPRAAYDVVAVRRRERALSLRRSGAGLAARPAAHLGRASDPAWRDKLDYRQQWRFFFWRTEDLALDAGYVIAHSANTHVIPATANLKRALLALDRGDVARLQGLLVDVSAPGFRWPTSLKRTDHGDQGCEILYVESLERDGRIYR